MFRLMLEAFTRTYPMRFAAIRHASPLPAAAALLIALAGCAATPPAAPATAPQAARAAPTAIGTIVAVRPVQADDWRRSVLAALGTPGAAPGAGVAEFIVRLEDGRAISVVQPDPGTLRAGSRVAVLPGGQALGATRIAAITASR